MRFAKILLRMSSSLKVLQNSAENPSGPGLFFVGRFLMTSISLLEIDLFKLCMSSRFSLGVSQVFRNLLISLRFSILLEYRFSKQLLIMFCISIMSVVIFPCSFRILVIWVFSLLLFVSVAKGLSILFIFQRTNYFVNFRLFLLF